MNMFCSENCKNLFQAATDYYAGELTPSKAKAIVEKADLSNKDNFKPSIVKFIDELSGVKAEEIVDAVSEAVEVPETKENDSSEEVKAEEVKIDSEPSDEVVEVLEEVKEDVSEKKPYKKNRKKYFEN
jgi:Ran GTPase-activating protein (RanGAP) involved in mRNA processing and transport